MSVAVGFWSDAVCDSVLVASLFHVIEVDRFVKAFAVLEVVEVDVISRVVEGIITSFPK